MWRWLRCVTGAVVRWGCRARHAEWRFARSYGLCGGTPGSGRGAYALLIREPLVSLYPAVLSLASPAENVSGWPPGLAGAGMVAIRVADLRFPARPGTRDGRTALTAVS